MDLAMVVGFSIGSPGIPYSRLACEQCGADMRTTASRFSFLLVAELPPAQWVLRFDRSQEISVTLTFGHDAVMGIQA